MIKKVISGIMAIAMIAAVTAPTTAFAASDKCNVTIKAVPPQEWLDDGNYEFTVLFEGAGGKKRAFLDEDNGFEDTVELNFMQPYSVSFSEDVADYELGGIDTELFLPDKEEMTVILSFKGAGNVAKTDENGEITKEQAERLAEAREVVQQFLNDIDECGIDERLEETEHWYMLAEDFKNKYKPVAYSDLTKKELFLYCYLTEFPENFIECSDPDFDENDVAAALNKTCFMQTEVDQNISMNIGTVWLWLYNQGVEYGSMPDLFKVYLDMKNGVEYKVKGDDNDYTNADVVKETESRMESSQAKDDTEEDIVNTKRTGSKSEENKLNNKKPSVAERMIEAVKNSAPWLIALVILAATLCLVKKFKKKKSSEEDEE